MTQHSRNTPQFYLTAPSPCPYLPGHEERKVFTHLVGERAAELNDLLTHGGFRRSQSIAYRPACETCRACVSVRVIVDEFEPTRSMRRIQQRNDDLIGDMRAAVPTSEQYSVFRSYLDLRHRDGGMADMTVLDYAMMVEDSHVETRIVEYRRRGPDSSINGRGAGELLAVALTDVLGDGLSMVYSYFDADQRSRSLGTFMILDHIARARRMGLPYVYLGYWVQGSRKMDYKGRFLPQERLTSDGWKRVERVSAVDRASARRHDAHRIPRQFSPISGAPPASPATRSMPSSSPAPSRCCRPRSPSARWRRPRSPPRRSPPANCGACAPDGGSASASPCATRRSNSAASAICGSTASRAPEYTDPIHGIYRCATAAGSASTPISRITATACWRCSAASTIAPRWRRRWRNGTPRRSRPPPPRPGWSRP